VVVLLLHRWQTADEDVPPLHVVVRPQRSYPGEIEIIMNH
jgi:hypothetical protein